MKAIKSLDFKAKAIKSDGVITRGCICAEIYYNDDELYSAYGIRVDDQNDKWS